MGSANHFSKSGSYIPSTSSAQQPTLDHICYENDRDDQIKQYYPNLRYSDQLGQLQTSQALVLAGRGGGVNGKGHPQVGAVVTRWVELANRPTSGC